MVEQETGRVREAQTIQTGLIMAVMVVVMVVMEDMVTVVIMEVVIKRMKKKITGMMVVMIRRRRDTIHLEMKLKKILKCLLSLNQLG